MRKKKGTLISAVTPLRPKTILDVKTGSHVSLVDFEKETSSLVGYVQTETKRAFEKNPEQVVKDAGQLTGSANSYARRLGYSSSHSDLPKEILAKSRINMLFHHKLMSEVASYAKSENPNKQYPSFPKTINLGAVDKQMASLSQKGEVLTLLWKCWSRELLIEFTLPSYVLNRNIIKFSLPLVRHTSKGYEFIFTVQENTPTLPKTKNTGGIDLGRVEPYTLVVTNNKGNRIAHYATSGRLKGLNHKRENILSHKRHINAKIDQYEKLGLITGVLVTEKQRLGIKAKTLGKVMAQQLGSEIAIKLAKHNLNILNVENLSWVKGNKYGSKWNHSAQQDAISHALARKGTKVKKINPKNSSTLCHACGTALTSSGRKVRCAACQSSLDRDFNAAMNLSSNRHLTKRYPSLSHRLSGDNCSPLGQVIDISHSSENKNDLLQLQPL